MNSATLTLKVVDVRLEDLQQVVGPPDANSTVPVFRQKSALEDAIGSHACSLDAIMNSVTHC
jgi:hypothetical protein